MHVQADLCKTDLYEQDSPSFGISLQEDQMQSIDLQPTSHVCPTCGYHYENEKEFRGLLEFHVGSTCWKCDGRTKKKEDFETSSKHSKDLHCYLLRPYKCQECNLIFDRPSQLDYHHRSTHLGEKSQICQVCGKGFFRKTDLRTHLNIHLGINLCICEICGKKFNHVSNLIRHCRMHTGVKPYPCSRCGKRFTQVSSLARHKKIHDRPEEGVGQKSCNTTQIQSENCDTTKQTKINKRQHYCKVCGKSFNFVFLLRQHEKCHSENTEILECTSCKRVFQEVVDLKVHKCYSKDFHNSDRNNEEKHSDLCQELLRNSKDRESYASTKLPLDTVICVTSKQFEKINLDHVVDTTDHSSDDPVEAKEKMAAVEMHLNKIVPTGVPKTTSTNGELLQLTNEFIKPSAVTHEEPMLRLVQTETGEQFYEFIISNLVEMASSTKCTISDTIQEGMASIGTGFNHINTKNTHEDEVRNEQGVENVTNIHDNLNYIEDTFQLHEKDSTITHQSVSEYLFYGNPKSKVCPMETSNKAIENTFGSQILLENETQTDFDGYAEVGLEVFERLNSEKNPEHLLEYVETEENELETCTYKDSPAVCLVQSEGEQFFELLHDSQAIDKHLSQTCHVEAEHAEHGNENSVTNIDRLIDATCLEEFETNSNHERVVQKSDDLITNIHITGTLYANFTNICETVKTSEEPKKSKTSLKKYHCSVCKKSFSSRYNYKQHIGTHFTDQQNFRCQECRMSFAWKSTLNKHVANNHRPDGPQKFVCDICPKVYSTLSQVNEHVRRDHLKQRNHTCPHCGKSFFKKFDLKIHSRTHTNERPYVCQACGKRFHHQSHIIRHERIHSGERPYVCDICQRTFTQAGSLKVHKQKHQQLMLDILDYQIDEDDPLALGTL
ncbi:hypothetical protein KM043_007277 [Ampulex compressa]|nr:hypothetical protein KM043_007277 [Ampulex compressa]